MFKKCNSLSLVSAVVATLSLTACNSTQINHAQLANNQPLPLSDQKNSSGWVLNTQVSDEFDATSLDEDKWYVVGKLENGKPVYKHPDKPKKRVWKGRAPSQFSGDNYRLEDGKLILETRWQPDFPFEKKIHKPVFGKALPYENLTTACIIGRRFFTYGYVEIKAKAADAEVSSAFWAMGDHLEIDFFELFGDARGKNSNQIDNQLWWSVRDWQPIVRGKPTYTEKKDLGFRVADDFHVYGFEWDEAGIKYYVDGKLFSQVTAEEVTKWARKNRKVPDDYNGYVATKPISLWLDQEAFPWHGIPDSLEDLEQNSPEDKKLDGVVDYEIEYVRIWQKPHQLNK